MITDEEIISIALSFDDFGVNKDFGCVGVSDLDNSVYVEEYPMGEALTKFARAIYQLGRQHQRESDELKPEWIVNDAAELGVKIGDRCFFLYKGDNIEYSGESEITMYRPVFKREFGECCHPINYSDYRLNGTVSSDDSDEWKSLPKRTGRKSE